MPCTDRSGWAVMLMLVKAGWTAWACESARTRSACVPSLPMNRDRSAEMRRTTPTATAAAFESSVVDDSRAMSRDATSVAVDFDVFPLWHRENRRASKSKHRAYAAGYCGKCHSVRDRKSTRL